MRQKTSIPILVLLIGCALLPACAPQSNVIQVATDATWEPFEYIDPITAAIVGFDIDLMTAIADVAGLDVEFVDVRWTPLLEGMAQCLYPAAISSITVTEERSQQFLFSDPYLAAGQVVIARASDVGIKSKDDLGGKRIGVQLDTTGEIEARQVAEADVRTYDDIDVAIQELLSGALDAVIADSPLALTYEGQYADFLKIAGEAFTDEVYAIAICKENTELLAQINRGLAAVKAAGLIDELIQKWMYNK